MSATGVELVATIDVFGLDVLVSSVVVGRMLCWPPATFYCHKTEDLTIPRRK